ncbi:pancreatic triacylglycerol lipase-like [Pelobates cultripes]|uniref:Triacylglycerol lipase n=1 Tax=Pelobates cultripes TaxID=61616 RepID=A0AAD1TBM3_PELCU|nr:pancreatic triacylglycerol lipase-like [Pelobates cultripes]
MLKSDFLYMRAGNRQEGLHKDLAHGEELRSRRMVHRTGVLNPPLSSPPPFLTTSLSYKSSLFSTFHTGGDTADTSASAAHTRLSSMWRLMLEPSLKSNFTGRTPSSTCLRTPYILSRSLCRMEKMARCILSVETKMGKTLPFDQKHPICTEAEINRREVCYRDIGCFTDDEPWSGTLERPIAHLPSSPESINTRFMLFTKENPEDFQYGMEFNVNSEPASGASSFQATRKSRFIIHGFIDYGKDTWLQDMCKAMLEVEDVNCFCIDWSGGSLTLYTQASNNVRVVGALVAYFIDTLVNNFRHSPSQIHIIGHSLGAHIAGEVGKRRPGIGRITGLDPAEPYFQGTPIEVKLDPSDAYFVDVIHTDGSSVLANYGFGGYGTNEMSGHLDFFPNGGERMAGCSNKPVVRKIQLDHIWEDVGDAFACNHLRSYKYYTESILSPEGFVGYPANSYETFILGDGFPCPSGGCPLMGHYADTYKGVTGRNQKYFLNTGAKKPFSRWRYKVTVHMKGDGNMFGYFQIALLGKSKSSEKPQIYNGLISPGNSYTSFIDVETEVGAVTKDKRALIGTQEQGHELMHMPLITTKLSCQRVLGRIDRPLRDTSSINCRKDREGIDHMVLITWYEGCYLHFPDDSITAEEVLAFNESTLSTSKFKNSLKSRFVIHGFISEGEASWLADMCNEMLKVEDINCFCVNWQRGAHTLYTQAVNVRVVGAVLAYFIDTLMNTTGYSPSNVHLIGHSLGAQVAGEAGKRRPGISRITGLSPAGPYFQGTPPEVRLDITDAELVDVIHTDTSSLIAHLGFKGYGTSQLLGNLDFFPNGGEEMPGCEFHITMLFHPDELWKDGGLFACNHLRSYRYYTASITNREGFIGFKSDSYEHFQLDRRYDTGEGFPCPATGCPLMGHYADTYAGITPENQVFYLDTAAETPYLSWRYKITVRVTISTFYRRREQETAVPFGYIIEDSIYTTYIDVELYVGELNQVIFHFKDDMPDFLQPPLANDTIVIQFGKDGKMVKTWYPDVVFAIKWCGWLVFKDYEMHLHVELWSPVNVQVGQKCSADHAAQETCKQGDLQELRHEQHHGLLQNTFQ